MGPAQQSVATYRFVDAGWDANARIEGNYLVFDSDDAGAVVSVMDSAYDIVHDWGNEPEERSERAATIRLYRAILLALPEDVRTWATQGAWYVRAVMS